MSKKAELNEVFSTCSADSLPEKETHLIALGAQLACCDCRSAVNTIQRAAAAGASAAEIACVACLASCVGGYTGAEYAEAKREETGEVALDDKTGRLVSLAICLAANCECSAGHLVEARKAGASEEEIARAACITACVNGHSGHWRFAAAVECADGQESCVC